MDDFSITIDAEKLKQMLKKYPVEADKAIQKALQQSADAVKNEAKELAPVDRSTLRRSITSKIVGYRAYVGTDLEYARIQELGGHIYPKKAKALCFRTKDGKFHRVKHVYIPAYRGTGYMRPALDKNRKNIEKIFANAIASVLKK